MKWNERGRGEECEAPMEILLDVDNLLAYWDLFIYRTGHG